MWTATIRYLPTSKPRTPLASPCGRHEPHSPALRQRHTQLVREEVERTAWGNFKCCFVHNTYGPGETRRHCVRSQRSGDLKRKTLGLSQSSLLRLILRHTSLCYHLNADYRFTNFSEESWPLPQEKVSDVLKKAPF